jgi:hypothetical protein
MLTPKWITSAGFLGTITERVTTSTSIEAVGGNVAYALINGSLPGGLRLNTGTGYISGTPYSVGQTIRSRFVVRATNEAGITDRTFYIDTDGPTDPEWLTPGGFLPAGINGQYYLINKQLIDYQLSALYDKLPTNQKLRYYIADNDGELPPGVILTEDGRLTGQVVDKLKLTYKAANRAGYDIEPNDEFPYDHVTLTESVVGSGARFIPKVYQFKVTVTDGVANSKQFFKLKVEDPSTFRVDTTYIDVDSNSLTVDSGYLFSPQWLTPANLGYVRANNQQVIQLSVYDFIPSVGPKTYNWGLIKKFAVDYPPGTTSLTLTDVTGLSYGMAVSTANLEVTGTIIGINRPDKIVTLDTPTSAKVFKGGNILFDIARNQDGTASVHPDNFTLDSQTGVLYATLPYQPAFSKTYKFTIQVTKVDRQSGNQTSNLRTFTMIVKGDVESTIRYTSNTLLGSLVPGQQSELAVMATHVGEKYKISYSLLDGRLPAGLELKKDGSVAGSIEYDSQLYFDRKDYGYQTFKLDGGTTTIDKTYRFTVQATDIFDKSAIEKEFHINVLESDVIKYTNIYAQAMLSVDKNNNKRNLYRDFMTNNYTFPSDYMYRVNDPAFGIQYNIRLPIDYGLEQVKLSMYRDEIGKYFYRKKFAFGNVNWTKATDADGNYVYDFVYVEIVEESANTGPVTFSGVTVYPNSAANMRASLENVRIEGTRIHVDEYLRPRFMRTVQASTGAPLGFILAVPLCYALPGKGAIIVKRIKLSEFDFKNIHFEIDRLVIENSLENTGAKYLLFPRRDIRGTNLGESYSYIFTQDSELRTEQGDPILLE